MWSRLECEAISQVKSICDIDWHLICGLAMVKRNTNLELEVCRMQMGHGLFAGLACTFIALTWIYNVWNGRLTISRPEASKSALALNFRTCHVDKFPPTIFTRSAHWSLTDSAWRFEWRSSWTWTLNMTWQMPHGTKHISPCVHANSDEKHSWILRNWLIVWFTFNASSCN